MLGSALVMATIPAENLQRAVEFYRTKLGLTKLDLQNGTATFQAGEGSTIFIYERARTQAEHTALTFLVKDVEATVTQLSDKGIQFEQYDMPGLKTNAQGIAEMGAGTKMAWFKDPEGNILALAPRA